MEQIFFLSLFCLLCGALASSGTENFYSLSAKDITGKMISFERYSGKIVLVVNVASECGYTDYNYNKLNQLQLRYGQESLAILAFPCNQFGAQEPAKDSEIDSMIRYKYNPRFPLFSKVNVTGETQSEIYRFLINSTNGLEPKWNFCKYLLDRDGLVVQFFDQGKTFDKIYESIDELLYRKRREL